MVKNVVEATKLRHIFTLPLFLLCSIRSTKVNQFENNHEFLTNDFHGY